MRVSATPAQMRQTYNTINTFIEINTHRPVTSQLLHPSPGAELNFLTIMCLLFSIFDLNRGGLYHFRSSIQSFYCEEIRA